MMVAVTVCWQGRGSVLLGCWLAFVPFVDSGQDKLEVLLGTQNRGVCHWFSAQDRLGC